MLYLPAMLLSLIGRADLNLHKPFMILWRTLPFSDKLKIYKSFLKSCWIKSEGCAASHPLGRFPSVIINNCDSTKAEKLQIRINTN